METLNHESYTSPLVMHKLNSEEKEIIRKLKKMGISCRNTLDIINIDESKLNSLNDIFPTDLNFRNALNKLQYKMTNTKEFVRKYMAPISFSSMQRELMECLEYIKTLSKDEQAFFKLSISPSNTLEKISTQLNINLRTAKKQFKDLYDALRERLCYKSEKYKNYLTSIDTNDIRLEMPELWSKFSDNSFFIFIKNIFEMEEDFSTPNQIDNIDINECFDNIFSELVMPCSIDTFRNSFYEYEGLNYTQINNLMPKIEQAGLIKIENKKVISAKLTFKTAVIQTLLQSPKEVSWNDILQKINQQGLYTSNVIPSKEDFINSLGLYDSIIQFSEDYFIHVDKSNVTMALIDTCVEKIKNIKKSNAQFSIEELQKNLNEKISVFELEHILKFCN